MNSPTRYSPGNPGRSTLYFGEAPDRVDEVLAFDRVSATQAPDEAVSAKRPRGTALRRCVRRLRCDAEAAPSRHGRPFSTAAISASERS